MLYRKINRHNPGFLHLPWYVFKADLWFKDPNSEKQNNSIGYIQFDKCLIVCYTIGC